MEPEQIPKISKKKPKRRRTRNTMQRQKEIIEMYEGGMTIAEIGRRCGKSPSTISSIVGRKEKIKQADVAKGVNMLTKQRSQAVDDMEKLLLVWIKEKESEGEFVSTFKIREKARLLYADLAKEKPGQSVDDFKASRGWFWKFMKRSDMERRGSVSSRWNKAGTEELEDNVMGVEKSVDKLKEQKSQAVDEVEKMLLIWIRQKESEGVLIPKPKIREKARQLYADLVKEKKPKTRRNSLVVGSKVWFSDFRWRTRIPSASNRSQKASRNMPRFEDNVEADGFTNQRNSGLLEKEMANRTFIKQESPGTSSKEEEKKDHPIPFEPSIVIKEEPIDYDEPIPSTSTATANYEFILPHQENTWAPPAPVVEPQLTFSVASLAPANDPETPDGELARKKRKIQTATSVPTTNGPDVRPQSPVDNFGDSSNPGSTKESRKDQFDAFGEYIAAKLRSLDLKSCAYAQKAIGDIIFEAEMGKFLNEDSDGKDLRNCVS